MERFRPFLEEILKERSAVIDSIHITGSALTADYNPKRSDINSVIVLKEPDLDFFEFLAPLGKKYGKRSVAAPLVITPSDIHTSLDVFPLEFLNIRLLHKTVHGTDCFQDIEIAPADLRGQCEREIRSRLIGLRQAYLSSAADPRVLTEAFVSTISGYIPLFRGILYLSGAAPPLENQGVLDALDRASLLDTEVFRTVLKAKNSQKKIAAESLGQVFRKYSEALETLGGRIDALCC